jgi:cAMP phosphodiesterase
MRIRMLPSTFDEAGAFSSKQHFQCLVINGKVALDAGSLASSVTSSERSSIRNVVLTHAHLDHIAGLPLFIDDLFPVLTEPVRIHAAGEVIDALETHIFNWQIYPRFSELKNRYGEVIEYSEIFPGTEFDVRGLKFLPIAVNHKVPSMGFVISDADSSIAITGDTAEMTEFWHIINSHGRLDALFVECAFPDEFDELSSISHHLTPQKLGNELTKFGDRNCPIYVINIKPAYRSAVVSQLESLGIENLSILEVGREYKL